MSTARSHRTYAVSRKMSAYQAAVCHRGQAEAYRFSTIEHEARRTPLKGGIGRRRNATAASGAAACAPPAKRRGIRPARHAGDALTVIGENRRQSVHRAGRLAAVNHLGRALCIAGKPDRRPASRNSSLLPEKRRRLARTAGAGTWRERDGAPAS